MSFSTPRVSNSNLTSSVDPVSTYTLGHVAGSLLEPQLQAAVSQQFPLSLGLAWWLMVTSSSPQGRETLGSKGTS